MTDELSVGEWLPVNAPLVKSLCFYSILLLFFLQLDMKKRAMHWVGPGLWSFKSQRGAWAKLQLAYSNLEVI